MGTGPFFADWNVWLDRGELFATLRVFADPESLARPEGGGKEAKAWLQANGEKIRNLVAAMATVVPPENLAEVNRMNAEKLFGVPAKTFDNLEAAVAWIRELVPGCAEFKHDDIARAVASAL